MRVVIHADASASIGAGHVVRCLALAAALRQLGADAVLASDALLESLARRAEEMGVPRSTRSAAPPDPDRLVIDGYHIDAELRAALAHEHVPRVIIDDLGVDHAGASMVLNQNLFARPGIPPVPADAEGLAGPTYALLGREFLDVAPERPQPPVAERVLVTMGGADPGDATSIAVEALSRLEPRPRVRVIVGAAHPSPAAVEGAADAAGFESLRDVPSLAPHLAWCDLVISGCGSSVLQAARLGRPVVGVVLADNQRRVADAVEDEALGVVAGEHPTLEPVTLLNAVEALRQDQPRRLQIAETGPRIVDGKGSDRAARAVLSGPVRLRPATMEDADLLLSWRNDPAARRASFDTATVDRAGHLAWLAERLPSPSHRIWIGAVAGDPIGSVRFSIEGHRATISVVLSPRHRGAGLGTRLIATASARLFGEHRVSVIEALMRPGNAASSAAFRLAGYRPVASEADRTIMRLTMG